MAPAPRIARPECRLCLMNISDRFDRKAVKAQHLLTPTVPLRAYNCLMQNLTNRIALVTGGSRGIGAAIAVAFAKAGADIAVNYRERDDAAQEICTAITASAGGHWP